MAKSNLIWPPAVYVAKFAGGEDYRMSLAWRVGKPIDHDKGRRGACQIIGNERGRAAALRPLATRQRARDKTYGPSLPDYAGTNLATLLCRPFPAATDIVSAHVEWNGEIYPDPAFLPTAAQPVAAKAKPDPLARVLAAVGKLSADQRAAVLAALVPIAGFDDMREAA